jgi:hypothetical protein
MWDGNRLHQVVVKKTVQSVVEGGSDRITP